MTLCADGLSYQFVASAQLTCIYALADPRDGTVRYVGKADQPSRRLAHHIKPHLLSARTQKNSWIKSLLSVGLKPALRLLEEVPQVDWEAKERFWISHLRSLGQPLTNGTDGGDGGAPSAEARAKISAKLRGRKLSQEQRRKMSLVRRGKRRNPEAVRNFSLSRMGHSVSEETRCKLSLANRGRKHTEAARLAIAAAGRGRRQNFSKSKYLGVSAIRRNGLYESYLLVNKAKKFFLGHYTDEKAAAHARDLAAESYFGSAAVFNSPRKAPRSEMRGVPFPELLKIIRQNAREQIAKTKYSRYAKTSAFRGINWVASRKCWDATIALHRRNVRLGSYRSESEAALAYDRAAQIVYGPSAALNFASARFQEVRGTRMDSDIMQELTAIRNAARERNKLFPRKRPGASSAFFGVAYNKARSTWQAYVKLGPGKRVYAGAFQTAEEAARAHDRVAREHLGTRANLNFKTGI